MENYLLLFIIIQAIFGPPKRRAHGRLMGKGAGEAHGRLMGGSWVAHGRLMEGSWRDPGAHEGGLMESFLLLFIILRATFDPPKR